MVGKIGRSFRSARGQIAIAGDTIAVGAYMTDEESGAAYPYVKSTSGWPTTPTTTISDPAASENDYFPSVIALFGTTLVFCDDDAGGNAGSAYIYPTSPCGWPTTPTATLPPPAGSFCSSESQSPPRVTR